MNRRAGSGMVIDAPAHVDLDGETPDVALAEIAERRILTMGAAMDLPSYERTLKIAAGCPRLLPAFGVHPWKAAESVDRLAELRRTTAADLARTDHTSFARLIRNDPRLAGIRERVLARQPAPA
jgi:Tat protein secretion system quality control protein TatD with DNase activity